MSKDYIELNRKFVELAEEEIKASIDYSRFLRSRSDYSWPELLQEYQYIVVLGEAGTGKTKELENRCRILREHGESAFFTSIEILASEDNVRNTLRNSDQNVFDDWLGGDRPGYFFLDSIDEAKLREKSFETALRHLEKSLTTRNMLRAKIIISCRVSDWRFRFDKETFEKFIPIEKTKNITRDGNQNLSGVDKNIAEPTSTSQTDQLKVNVFSISPLDKNQVKILAEFYGIENYNEFISAIDENDYWHLSERPQDIEWLSSYWKSNNKLGRYAELIENNIDKKLEEVNVTRPRFGEIARDKLREGAEILASAITLSKKSFISLPDEYRNKTSLPDSVNPEEVLFDWKPDDIENLLSRGIFDEATYGRVKFHHRTVVEYLVACWIKKLIDKGCPFQRINDILFGNTFGIEVIKQSLQPTVAWLSLFNAEISQKVVKYYPEVLISFGDPASLNRDIKKRIIINFCKKYENNQRIGIEFESISLKRFVDISLEEIVLSLYAQYKEVHHIKLLLIRLCKEGRFKKSAILLLNILKNNNEDATIRGSALNAIIGIEDNPTLLEAKAYILRNANSLPYNLAGEFVEIFYPDHLDINELINFVKQSEPNWNESWRSIPNVLYDIAEHNWFNIPSNKLEELLEALVILVNDKLQSSNKDNRFGAINTHYRKIGGAISSLLRRQLSSKNENELKIDVVSDAVQILKVYHKHFNEYLLEKEKVKELITKFANLKKELFYRKIKREESKGIEVKYLNNFLFFFYDFWDLGKNDLNWLIQDLRQSTETSKKHILLDSILHLLRDNNSSIEKYGEIKSIICDSEDLLKHYTDFINPQKRKPDKFIAKIERDEKKLKHQQEIQLDENKKYLLDHLDSLRKGKELNTLHYLVEKMAAKGSRNSWGQNNLKAIEDMFGIEVKHAAKEGFKVFWRSWSPPLPHEIEDRNKTEYGVIIGLSGIAIEISDKFDVTAFSEADAELATRYATREINNFPPWLKDIAVVYPDAVKKTLNLCIESEFNTPKEKPIPHEVLATLVHAEIILKEMASQKIYELIKTKTPDHLINVSYALSILLNSSLKDSVKVKKLIGNKTNNIKNDVDAFIVWFDAWLNLDFTNAVNYLGKKLKKLNAKESYDLMVNLCGELSRSRHYSYLISFDLGKISEIKSLVKFLRLVYMYIKSENDNVYLSGFTPDIRDDAQHFRGRLLDRLLSIPGKESYNALINLSKESDLVSSRDVFQYLAKGKAEKETESEVWRPQDVTQFYLKFTKEIKSDEELFHYILEKIDEIKDHIEKGDVSTRGLFNSKTKESEFQKWIADRLRLIGMDNYSVTREEEVDDLKKPDLRIRKNNFIVGIEIKIVNEYSIQELSRAISNQLINSYLKDINSKYGIFLLVNVKDKEWIHPKTKNKLDINQITKYLSDYADKLNSKNKSNKMVRVININFEDRV